ncbi:lipopolysaccharide transport periplasmic protein LptA [Thioclava sp. BHET1]|nr:lipopolysaccharide transport periplasmic protein LptA [Thioclava sp. BHET1]
MQIQIRPKRTALLAALLVALAAPQLVAPAHAQGTAVSFSGMKQDPNLPVAVTADKLDVSQADSTATFTGNVVATQGTMRLAAPKVRVEYEKGANGQSGKISKLFASGGVTLTTGTEAAEGKEAVYTVTDGHVRMTGDVVVTQGQNAMSGQTLVIDLGTGTGQMEGRVQTVFQPKAKQ